MPACADLSAAPMQGRPVIFPRPTVMLASVWLGITPAGYADMSDTSGLEPWEVCALCHGAEGISATARFPHLAGQKADYLRRQLQAFARGARDNDEGQMKATAEAVPSGAIDTIVAHFAALPPPTAAVAVDAGHLALGERLFNHGRDTTESDGELTACATCHARPETAAPWLFGQHAAYLQKQLADFADGVRDDSAEGVMSALASRLSQHEISAVSAYLEAAAPCSDAGPEITEKHGKNSVKTLVMTSYDDYCLSVNGHHRQLKKDGADQRRPIGYEPSNDSDK